MQHAKIKILTVLLFALSFAAPASATVVSVYWSGTITDYLYFGGDAPAGVANGVPIFGEFIFDTAQHDARILLSGSHTFGERYRYYSNALMRLNVAGSEWVISGVDINLLNYVFETKQAFDVFSTSERNDPTTFPGYVGEFEGGFALFAANSPFSIFDTTDIEAAVFDFENPTSGAGFITTRLLDENDDIVEGYYFSFDINQSSSSPIPEPSIPLLLAVGSCAIFSRRSRLTRCRTRRFVQPATSRCVGGLNPSLNLNPLFVFRRRW